MAIQFKYFQIPARGDESQVQQLNAFLSSVQVLQVKHEFVSFQDASFWCVMVEYLQGKAVANRTGEKKRKDYREILSPEDFALFVKFREWRKERAAGEQVPVYTILTNEQLAHIAQNKPGDIGALREVEGIGEARSARYGAEILAILHNENRKPGESG